MRNAALICLINLLFAVGLQCQTTEFTYQGRLTASGIAATSPHDFEFRLFTAAEGGTQLGTTVPRSNVPVLNGVFTVPLDFGDQFDGTDRWLRIDVRPAGGPAFETLTPRQRITSAPYNIKSRSAASADIAIDAQQLNGLSASNYVLTSDTRLSDPRDPLPNSGNYIQNRTTPQAASNFNVSGDGTAGGTLTANVVTATQFNTGGARVFKYEFANGNTYAGFLGNPAQSGTNNSLFGNLAGLGNTGSGNSIFGSSAARSSNTGNENSIFGANAGFNNTGGQFNAFFGANAGFANQTGNLNSFFGFRAGTANTTGVANAFLGSNAGFSNTQGQANTFVGNGAGQNSTEGFRNTFLGDNTGHANTTGNLNTLLGAGANVGANGLSNATAIGAGSVVSASNTIALGRSGGQDAVIIPGTLAANGSGLTNLNANNITTGTLAIGRGGTGLSAAGSAGTFLRSNGTTWISSTLQASDIPAGSGNYIQNNPSVSQSASFHITGDGTVGGTLRVGGTGILGDPPGLLALQSGMVGIGTDAPVGKLHLRQDDPGALGPVLTLTNGGGNGRTAVDFEGYDTGANLPAARIESVDSNFSSHLSFQTKTPGAAGNPLVERMRITADGNVLTPGTLSAAQYNVAGVRMLTANGPYNAALPGPNALSNTFVGESAGLNVAPDPDPSLPTGKGNTFVGASAGLANTSAGFNTFIGRFAGRNEISGGENVFVGAHTGFAVSNNGGAVNTSIGTFSRVTENLSYQTAIGARALVTQSNSLVLGAIAGVNASPVSVNVGIGTTAPGFKLHVIDGSNTGLRVQTNTAGGTVASFGGSGAFQIDSSGIPGGRFTVLENGRVGIGTTLPDQVLTVNGNASKPGGGSWALFSDERLKNITGRFTRGVADLMRLNPIRYEYKPDNALGLRGSGEYIGFSAQEVERVIPEAVSRSTNGYLQINNDPILWTTLNAVKDQQGQIEAQAAKINSQEDQIEMLKKQLELLRTLVCVDRPNAEICREK